MNDNEVIGTFSVATTQPALMFLRRGSTAISCEMYLGDLNSF